MQEKFSEAHEPSAEERADYALKNGDIQLARSILYSAIGEHYTDPETAHHLSLKALTLPFHQLIHLKEPDLSDPKAAEDFAKNLDAQYEEASAVYGWTGSLLEAEIDTLPPAHDELCREYRSQGIGNVTELTFLALLTRDVSYQSKYVPLAASWRDDTAQLWPVDFLLLPPYGKVAEPRLLQTKTLLKEDDRAHYYGSPVQVVGLNQLDPRYYGAPQARDSLAQTILRELAGRASDDDIQRLRDAVSTLQHLAKLNADGA